MVYRSTKKHNENGDIPHASPLAAWTLDTNFGPPVAVVGYFFPRLEFGVGYAFG